MRCTPGRHLRVVVPAQDKGGALQRVVPDPPTPSGVAVDLADAGIDPDPDGTYERRLTEIGTEAGPEVVVEIRSSVERARMQREPMSHRREERDEKGNPD